MTLPALRLSGVNTAAMPREFQPSGFNVFAGTETVLLKNMRSGGCITATANVNPTAIMCLYKTWRAADADAKQEALNKTRAIFQKVPMIPAMKAAIAEKSGDKVWATVRPPLVKLVKLDSAQRAQLIHDLAGTDSISLTQQNSPITPEQRNLRKGPR